MHTARLIRTAHRWLAWAVGVQVVIWVVTGLVMNLLANERVRSEHLRAQGPLHALPTQYEFLPPHAVLAHFSDRGVPLAALGLRLLADRVVYEATSTDGARLLVDARTGESLSPIGRTLAEQVARADRVASAPVGSVDLLQETDGEYRGETPVWRIRFDDEDHAAVFVSPVTGEVVGRTNWLWRIHDFVWMLHIMDYQDRSNYNNLVLRSAATLGVALALAGFALVVTTVLRRRRR